MKKLGFMMRVNRSTLAKLCLLTAIAVPVQPAVSATLSQGTQQANSSTLLLAQNSADSDFTLPASLDGADDLLIDGSSSMRAMNEALTSQFQERYETAEVISEANGSDVAIERLLDGDIDLAAIGRPLNEGEMDAGLQAVAIAREKIAIIVGPDNPFNGDITFEQFGQIFRGELTDWSELGGEPGPIRFVDRPDFSDTRQAFQPYPVFTAAPFETGATADPVGEDETDAVVEALGADGIGYAIANQVTSRDDVSIISMHKTLPDNPAYPFSQPRNYVYADASNPAVQGFLGIATGVEGQAAIAEVRDVEEAAAVNIEGPGATATSPDGELIARTTEENLAIVEDTDGNVVAGPLKGAGGAVTALAFSPDGETLATGTKTGQVRYWGVDGEPKGLAFPAIVGADNAVTDLRFEDNDKLFAGGSNGRRGFWGQACFT
ncbi:MAG: substrate-binding domain-containing protein [Cyanobacteria bacterium J06560_2]